MRITLTAFPEQLLKSWSVLQKRVSCRGINRKAKKSVGCRRDIIREEMLNSISKLDQIRALALCPSNIGQKELK